MPSYEQRGKKRTWTVRWREMTPEGEKNLRLSGFASKKEARLAYEEHIAKQKEAPVQIQTEFTMGQLIDEYYIYAKNTLKESSLYDSKSRIENHIRPWFGDMKCRAILPIEIMQWQTELSQKYSRKYILVVRGAFSAVWTYGVRFHNLETEPLRKVPLPKEDEKPKEEMQVWTPEEFSAFLSVIDEPIWKLFFRILYFTGARKGEITALQATDIGEGYISISKSVTRKGESPWTVTTPKNKQSVRKVSIDKSLTDELKLIKGPFLFGGKSPYGETTIERKWKKYIKWAGVKPIRIHDLRHSHASLLISHGVSIVAVSKRLGHSSTQQTLDTYSHMMPSDDEVILSVLESIR